MKSFKLLFLSLLVMFTVSCSNDDDDVYEDTNSIGVNELVGSWIASSSVHTNKSDTSEKYDIVGNGGEIRMTILQGGRVRTWIDFGTYKDEWDAQFSITGNTLSTTPAESTRLGKTYTIVKSGNSFTLTNSNDAFDFSLSGATPVPTIAVTSFVPNQ